VRLVILGGGGFRVPLVHRALAARPELAVDELVLYDVDPARVAVIAAVLPEVAGLRVRTSSSLPNSLHGADIVFSAIRVGGAAGRVRDERRALSLGILGQETVGAGGLTYGLRTLPVVLRIAATMAEVAPEARLINFTNPAGMITEALQTVLGPKVIGICDSPTGLIRRVCRAVGIPEADVTPDYLGINHLGWLRGLRHDGVDLLPGLLADDARLSTFEEGRLFGPELLRGLGAIPNEYLYFYYRNHEAIAALGSGQTRGEVVALQQSGFYETAGESPGLAAQAWEQARLDREQSYFAETRTAAEQRDAEDLSGGGYEEIAIDVMTALTGTKSRSLIVNAGNGKTVPQLPSDLVLEVLSEVDTDGAAPLPVGAPTLHQLGLMATVRSSERAAIDAVLTGSRSLAAWALASHPLVASETIGERLLEDLLLDEPGLADLLR
jgi:6-phospho-beta-glucosidase